MVLVCTTFFGYSPVYEIFDTLDALKEKHPEYTYFKLNEYFENNNIGLTSNFRIYTVKQDTSGCVFDEQVAGYYYDLTVYSENATSFTPSYDVGILSKRIKDRADYNLNIDINDRSFDIIESKSISETSCVIMYKFDENKTSLAEITYKCSVFFIKDKQRIVITVYFDLNTLEVETTYEPIRNSFKAIIENMLAEIIPTRTIGTLAE